MRRFATLACVAAIAACGLDLVGVGGAGTGPDVDGGGDPRRAGNDPADTAPEPDGEAEMDATSIDLGQDAGGDDAADAEIDAGVDAAIVFNCPTGNTTDCATCAGRPLGCVMCAVTGPGIYPVCVPAGSSCYASYRPAGYTWCRCPDGDPDVCKIPEQGCNPYDDGVCVTCGENLTQGDPCKGGGTCNQAARKCQ